MNAKKRKLIAKKKDTPPSATSSQDLLAQVVPLVSLDHLQLVRGAQEVLPSTTAVREDPLQLSVQHHMVPEDHAMLCTVTFEFLSRAPVTAESKPVVRITATYLLRYKLKPDASPSPEALHLFSRANGVHNAWPYWREYLQNSLQRLELPPLTLQLMRFESLVAWAQKAP